MKYFCLTLVAFLLSISSFGAIGTITGTTNLCQGSSSSLTNVTPGGTWTSGSPLIASVGLSTGVVTALFPGTAIINYITALGKASITVTVNATAKITGTTNVCVGDITTLSNPIFGGTWSSSTPALATVAAFLRYVEVTGVKAGVDTVFYNYPSGCKVSTPVTVKPLPPAILGSSAICVGDKMFLSDSVQNGVWSSSLPAAATIDLATGLVTGVGAGLTTISYTALNGCSSTTLLIVNGLPMPITGTMHAYHGYSTILSDPTPGGFWTSSYPSIATIDIATGKVTGVSAGVSRIFYTLAATGCRISAPFVTDGLPDSAGSYPLQGWFPFCGNSNDLAPKTLPTVPNNLITPFVGGFTPPTLAIDRFGMPGMAYQFHGNAANDILSGNSYSSATPTGDFVYSCWINYNYGNFPTDDQAALILYNGTPALNGFGFVIHDGDATTYTNPGHIISVHLGGVGNYLAIDPYSIPAFNARMITSGGRSWMQLMLRKIGNDLHFYVNGLDVGIVPDPFNPPSGQFFMGQDQFSFPPTKFEGFIDDIAVYNTSLGRDVDTVQTSMLYTFNPDPVPFTLGPDINICTDSIILEPIPHVIGRLYAWSTGNNIDEAIAVVPTANATTNYSLSITQPYGCASTDAINVTKIPLVVSLGVDTNICTGDTIILRGTHPFSTYTWNTGATSDTIKVFSTGNYVVTVDSGACRGHDTLFVNARVTPLVDLGPDIFNCNAAPATLINKYEDYDKGFDYVWSNGSNLEQLVTNTSGNFWVQVTNKGCSRADSITVLIVNNAFTFSSVDTEICLGRYVTGRATFNPIVNYQWTPTTGVPLSTLPSTNITPDTTATYVLTGRYPGCEDIVYSFHIDVQPTPTVSLGGNRHVCEFDTINIASKVTPGWYDKYIYKWTPATFLDDPTLPAVIFTAGDTTMLTLNVTTSAGCSGSDSSWIIVHPGNFDSLMADINVCPGDQITLVPNMYYQSGLDGVVATYLWQPGRYVSDSTATTPLLKAVTTENFRVIGTSQYGCIDTINFKVTVNPGAVMYLDDSAILHPGESFQVKNQTNASYFHWFPPLGVSDTNSSNPILSPATNTNYIVRAETEGGCKIIDSIAVRLDASTLLDVPNAFTPGGSVNARFFIIKRGIATLKSFSIFNRWGVKVFSTNNIDEGWDGMFNGKPQPFGVYVYQIDAVANNGEKFIKQGNITLIR